MMSTTRIIIAAIISIIVFVCLIKFTKIRKQYVSIITVAVIFFVSTVLGFIPLRAEKLEGTQGMLEKAREEISVADIENSEVSVLGSTEYGDSILVWFAFEGENNAKTYYPFEFNILADDKYSFVKDYIPIQRNQELCSLLWKDGYSFMVDSADCQYINIYDKAGTLTQIAVESVPFVYYCETVPSRYDYIDYNGNVINT